MKGGINSTIFRDFLQSVFNSLILNFNEQKKVIIILDSLPVHKTNYVKKFIQTSSMRLIYNLAHNSRSNPIEYFFGYLKGKIKDEEYTNFK